MSQLIVADEGTWVEVAAAEMARVISAALAIGGREVTVALSGGNSPRPVFQRLATYDLDWGRVCFTQVDERVVPEGDPARNLTAQQAALGSTGARWLPLPISAHPDVLRAFGEQLPARLDVIHLGLGADGHTASLVPGDPVLEVTDGRVALTQQYQGHRRVTLTVPELRSASQRGSKVMWLVHGRDKADALNGVLRQDPAYPASAVVSDRDLFIINPPAARRVSV